MDVVESTSNEANVQPSEMVTQEEEDVKMHCVWTSCGGTFCDEILSNEQVLIEYIEEFDRC